MSSSLVPRLWFGGHQVSSITSTPRIQYFGEYNIIRLKGNKKIDKEPEKLEDNIHNTREFGDFTLDSSLKTEECFIKNEN